MANFGRALQALRQERTRVELELERLEEAISVLQGLVGPDHVGRSARGGRTGRMGRPRRRMSAAGRRKIAAAQRSRWAKLRAKNLSRPASTGRQATNGRKPRRLNAAARNRIAAAQRARWAKLKTEKNKKTARRAPKKPAQKAQATAA